MRFRNRSVACVQQCRRRLRLERQSDDRQRPLVRRGSACRTIRRARASHTAATASREADELLGSILGDVELAYQNLESVELGVTSVDQYFDTLGGISRAVRRASGTAVPATSATRRREHGEARTPRWAQVALETRTRMLNPKWYEGMLKHGYEGVRQIESHVCNTMGWSATTGAVEPWGLSAADADLHASTLQCANAWRSSIRMPRHDWRRASSKQPPQLLDTGCRDRAGAAAG